MPDVGTPNAFAVEVDDIVVGHAGYDHVALIGEDFRQPADTQLERDALGVGSHDDYADLVALAGRAADQVLVPVVGRMELADHEAVAEGVRHAGSGAGVLRLRCSSARQPR